MKVEVEIPCPKCGGFEVDDKVENVSHWQCSNCRKFLCKIGDIESLRRKSKMKWNTLKKWLTIGDSTVRPSHGGSHQKIRTCPKCLSNQIRSNDGENFCLRCHHFWKDWKDPLVKGGQGRSAESVEASGKFVAVAMIIMAVILIVVAICSG